MGRQGRGFGERSVVTSQHYHRGRSLETDLLDCLQVCASRHEDSWVLSTIKERVVSTQYHFDSEEECM